MCDLITGLQSGVGGISSNATLVVSIPSHHDVAIHSPVGAPAANVEDRNVCTLLYRLGACMLASIFSFTTDPNLEV